MTENKNRRVIPQWHQASLYRACLFWTGFLLLCLPRLALAQSVLSEMLLGGTSDLNIAANPTTNRIYVACGGNNTLLALDGATNAVLRIVRIGQLPHGIAVNTTTNEVYVLCYNSNEVYVLDGNTLVTTGIISLTSPGQVTINPTANCVYITGAPPAGGSPDNGAYLYTLDGVTHTVLASTAIGKLPVKTIYYAATNRVYVLNAYSNTVSVVHATSGQTTNTIAVGNYPNGMAINPKTNKIHVSNSPFA